MTPEQKKIETAGAALLSESKRDAFYLGAISPEAKNYWQKGMYTEEEVYNIAAQSHSHGYSLCLGSTNDILEFPEWFELNKKK